MKKGMKDKVIIGAVAVALLGILIAEFRPTLLTTGGTDLAAGFHDPFDGYRNKLALQWGLGGAAIGAIAGYLWSKVGR